MKPEKIWKCIDHTQLKPTAGWEEICQLCREAIKYGAASVCIPPCYIERVKKAFGTQVNICTVIGFPLGYATKESKVFEAVDAMRKGAAEIDMVVNISDVKNREFSKVEEEIGAVKQAVEGCVLKVIIETCYLSEEEKIELCRIITEAGADFIKTSTGFGTAGASMEDIRLFKKYIGNGVRIKAAGGIKTREALEEYLEEGCSRIGTSSAAALLER